VRAIAAGATLLLGRPSTLAAACSFPVVHSRLPAACPQVLKSASVMRDAVATLQDIEKEWIAAGGTAVSCEEPVS